MGLGTITESAHETNGWYAEDESRLVGRNPIETSHVLYLNGKKALKIRLTAQHVGEYGSPQLYELSLYDLDRIYLPSNVDLAKECAEEIYDQIYMVQQGAGLTPERILPSIRPVDCEE